jgi:hypothetical protein
MIRLILSLLWIGGRRLRHIQFLRHDPLVKRFAGLVTIPDERTVSRWLGRFTHRTLPPLAALGREVVFRSIGRLGLRTLTIDLDGTVVSTGLQAEWAQRGYNPHHRKVPSYYPLLAHLAETGQVLSLKNRPGNVHDGVRGVTFLKSVIREVRHQLGSRVRLRFRMDGAFFVREIIEALIRSGDDFAIKVPMHRWLGVKSKIQMRTRWTKVADEVSGFETLLPIPKWRLALRVVCYRKKVFHETAKNYQLDFFTPDDGTYEYSAVTTSLDLSIQDLWFFMAGRGAQEKTIGELKDGLAFDTVPTKRYGANSAWQWLVVLAHNIHRDFQLARADVHRRRTKKKTYITFFESIRTTRFELINIAGRLLTLSTGSTLRLPDIHAIERRYEPWLGAA